MGGDGATSTNRIRRLLAVAGVVLAIGYIGIGIVGVLIERPLLFPGAGPGRPPSLPPGGRLLRIPHGSQEVVALYIPPSMGQRVLVHFHGNAMQLADLAGRAASAAAHGLGYMAIEYPGYGLAPGEPSETSLFEAAQVGLDHLHRELAIPSDQVVLEGQSIGTGVAVEMALRGHGGRLILISPYTSVADLGASVLPYHPRQLLVRDPLDSESKAPRVVVPTLIVHGSDDEVVPVWMGRRLASLFPRCELEVFPGAGHNDLLALTKISRRLIQFAQEP